MKQPIKFIVGLLLIANSILAQEIDWTQKIPFDESIKTGKLENGLTYYIKKNSKPANKVELRLVINAGSILEDDDQQGLAHFLEHMNFNGTKRFPKNKLVDYLESIGVKFGQHLNAYTSFDETVYFLTIPTDKPENLETGINIIEDWAFNASLTPQEIDKERGVVLEEYRLRLGSGKRMMDKYLPKLLYQSQYVERLPIGKKEIIETFKHESLARFYKDWYRPNLMSIIVVGDINEEEMEQMIVSKFSGYKNPKDERTRKSFDVPNHAATLVSIESDKEITNSSVKIIYKDYEAPKAISNLAAYKNYTIERIFGTMLDERFSDLVNSKTPPFLNGNSIYQNTLSKNKKAFQSTAVTAEGKQIDALKVLITENERVKKFGFTENELIREKKSWLGHFERHYNERNKKNSAGIVDGIQSYIINQEILAPIEWKYEIIQKILPLITIDEVNRLMKNYIKEDNRVIILTGPEKEGLKKVTEQEVLEVLKINIDAIEPYKDEAVATSLIRNEIKSGSIIKRKKNKKAGTKTLILSNGVKVTYKNTDFKNDEILFNAVSFGGTNLFSDSDMKKIQFAMPMVTAAGFSGLKLTDVSKFMSGKSANVFPYVGETREGLSGSATPKDLEYLFQMTYAYFTDLNFDADKFETVKQKQIIGMKNILNQPGFYFQQEISAFLNQNNPRYSGIIPTEKTWAETDYAMAYNKHKERFANAADFEFFFVGNIDDQKMEDFCIKYLAGLPATKQREKEIDLGYRYIKGDLKKVVFKGTDPKSSVGINFYGAAKYSAKESWSIKALADILQIKLTEQLRENESGVYGISAMGYMSEKPSIVGSYFFSIGFPCAPENAEKLTVSALNELQKIIDNGPEEKDLNKFKEGLLQERKEQIKKNGFGLSLLNSSYAKKGKIADPTKTEKNIKAIKAKDIQKVAKKYLSKDKVITMLMPETK
jgi:zinc protease